MSRLDINLAATVPGGIKSEKVTDPNSKKSELKTRCGYVALLGLANSGKSTLLNALIGTKISAVSAKPQTTRGRIVGILPHQQTQILLLDLPGLHKPRPKEILNLAMSKTAWSGAMEADIICFLIDLCSANWESDYLFLLETMNKTQCKVIVLGTKSDRLKKVELKKKILLLQQGITELFLAKGISPTRLLINKPTPVSAKRKESMTQVLSLIAETLPFSPWLYPEDELTNLSTYQVISELVKEQIFRHTGAEIPYCCTVSTDEFKQQSGKIMIRSAIVVGREPHKKMLIGNKGQKIKAIGMDARAALELFFHQPVFLDLHIEVQKNWHLRADKISHFEMITPT